MKKNLLIAGAMLIAAVATPALAQDSATSTTTMGNKPYFEASDTLTGRATIIKLDKKNRLVTLRAANGDTATIMATEEVQNFDKLNLKDVVVAKYIEKLTVHVEPAGTPETTEEASGGRAKPGEKPAAHARVRTQVKAKITAINKEKGTVTLHGVDGTVELTPLHPENLDKVSVGEMVVFTHTVGIGLSVEKAKTPSSSKKSSSTAKTTSTTKK